jgi:AbrB family looped-hinge helix DNA binding protein
LREGRIQIPHCIDAGYLEHENESESRLEAEKTIAAKPTGGFKRVRKEILRVDTTMSTDDPEITTVTSKGQITIPSRLRKQFGLEKGTKLMVVPTDYGLVLKKLELPSVEEFQKRVEERAESVDLTMKEVDELVHDARNR